MDVLRREFVYIWYYFTVQLEQIFGWWVLGMVIGSTVSTFAKDYIHRAFRSLQGKRLGVLGIVAASALGIASPLCMYGTIPISASFSKGGMKDDWLAAFMISSILLNPQLIIYNAALGGTVLTVRIASCFLCGITAGLLLHFLYRDKPFFNFSGFDEPKSRDTDPNLLMRYLKNLWRNAKATGMYFLMGVLLSALFQRYVPAEAMTALFGGNEALGVLMAATIGVPLYACGGGTIPLLQQWLWEGMSVGSAASFMLTGPSTKITNLGALKIVLGIRHFLLYLAYVMIRSYRLSYPGLYGCPFPAISFMGHKAASHRLYLLKNRLIFRAAAVVNNNDIGKALFPQGLYQMDQAVIWIQSRYDNNDLCHKGFPPLESLKIPENELLSRRLSVIHHLGNAAINLECGIRIFP